MKIRYQTLCLNLLGAKPVQVLKKALKLAGSENPNSKAISLLESVVK